MTVIYIVAALGVFFWGMKLIHSSEKNKFLVMLCGFVVASMAAPVTDSLFVWFIELLLIYILIHQSHLPIQHLNDCSLYLIFALWAFFSLSYSNAPLRGIRAYAVYIFPMFYYALSTYAFDSIYNIKLFVRNILKSTKFYALLGLFALFVGQFSTIQVYYGMSICVIPFALFLQQRKRVYILCFLLCLVPSILLVKRTPLLGVFMAIAVFSVLIYRLKAVIPLIGALALGVLLVVSIPQFRDKLFFGGDEMTIAEIASQGEMADNVNTSGRNVFWDYLFEEFYSIHPYIGSGVGSVKSFVQSDQNVYKESFYLVHNDWLLLLCETGLVGVLLLLLFFIRVFIKCKKYSSKKYPFETRLMAASCAGVLTCTMMHMFFENCMNSFVFPTLFVFFAILNSYIRQYRNQFTSSKVEVTM